MLDTAPSSLGCDCFLVEPLAALWRVDRLLPHLSEARTSREGLFPIFFMFLNPGMMAASLNPVELVFVVPPGTKSLPDLPWLCVWLLWWEPAFEDIDTPLVRRLGGAGTWLRTGLGQPTLLPPPPSPPSPPPSRKTSPNPLCITALRSLDSDKTLLSFERRGGSSAGCIPSFFSGRAEIFHIPFLNIFSQRISVSNKTKMMWAIARWYPTHLEILVYYVGSSAASFFVASCSYSDPAVQFASLARFQLKRCIDPMLLECWLTECPAFNQHLVNVSCLPDACILTSLLVQETYPSEHWYVNPILF